MQFWGFGVAYFLNLSKFRALYKIEPKSIEHRSQIDGIWSWDIPTPFRGTGSAKVGPKLKYLTRHWVEGSLCIVGCVLWLVCCGSRVVACGLCVMVQRVQIGQNPLKVRAV